MEYAKTNHRKRRQTMIECTILENGDLEITADEEAREYIADHADRNYWLVMADLFESYACNGSFTHFDAGQANPFVGLTSAPCVAEEMTTHDDGTNEIIGRCWYFNNYAIECDLEKLRDEGRVIYSPAE